MTSILFFALILPVVILATYILTAYLTGNIWKFGKLIRSAQLSEKRFEKLIKKHKPGAMICLRTNPNEFEKSICFRHGVAYFHVPLNSDKVPNMLTLKKIHDIYDIFGKGDGVYVHCMGGADRSGLASAIWCLAQTDNTDACGFHLSWLFGHSRKKKPAMVKALVEYACKLSIDHECGEIDPEFWEIQCLWNDYQLSGGTMTYGEFLADYDSKL